MSEVGPGERNVPGGSRVAEHGLRDAQLEDPVSLRGQNAECLWHVVITRFSYRNPSKESQRRKSADDFVRAIDPLDPARLEFRTRLFEVTCAPSLVAQTNQKFDWIVIIDKSLSASYRDRIRSAACNRHRTHLHEFSPEEDLRTADWLRQYAPKEITRLLTTMLDDDDGLPSDFVARMHARVLNGAAGLPPIMTFGARSCVMWDAVSSRRAPLGYVRTASHSQTYIYSAGFSVLSEVPGTDLTVFSIDHVLGDVWYDWQRFNVLVGHILPHLAGELAHFHSQAGAAIEDSRRWSARHQAGLFVDISADVGPVMMTNHFFNDESWRILEPSVDRRAVKGSADFPKIALLLRQFGRNPATFRKRWNLLANSVRHSATAPYQRVAKRYRKFVLVLRIFVRFVLL